MTVAYKFDNIIRRTIVATIFLLLSFGVAAQVTITGYVYDENRNPIIGASVIEKNGSATMTDVKGKFKIESSGEKPLTVAFIGCKLLEINEKEDKYVEVTLMPDKSKRESSYIAINAKTYQKALEGDAQSQFEMAEMYHGLNYKEAAGWYEKAANGGHAEAQHWLGFYYAQGWGVEYDMKKAFQLYKKSAEQGFALGYYAMGVCYTSGDGVPKNTKEAVRNFNLAAELGDAELVNRVGVRFATGTFAPKDEKLAVKWYRKAAKLGDSTAQCNLAGCYLDGRGIKQDFKEAVKWYRKAAEQGNAEAQNNLGECYYYGYGVTKDYTEAVKWFRKAAEKGNAVAQNYLGNCYYAGDGIKQDYTEAVKWYRKAAEQGDAEAQNNLGNCYSAGRGVKQDYTEAVKWYRKAAEQGNADAQNNLGNCYYAGYGVTKDYTETVKWYRKAAEKGNAEAQSNLGCCYYAGDGVTKDYNEAVKWFRKAAEQGNEWGLLGLGECYFDGYGVTKDYTEAVKWYRKAAEQGNATAQNNLGYCYYNGHGVITDYTEAIKWYRKAAEQGNLAGQFHLGECYYYGHGVTKDYTEAVKWFRKDAEQGTAKAQNQLGDCYYYGHGVTKDFKEAVKWYQLAAEQGNAEAQNALGHCYAMGEGVPYDMEEAVAWWTFAANQGNIEAKLALESLEKEREKGVNPPTSLPTLLTGVSSYDIEKDSQQIVEAIQDQAANAPAPYIEPLTSTTTYTAPQVETPQLRVLSDSKVTFSDTRQEVRFAISDDSHTIKYRIDGGATTTLPAQVVQAGVCEIELPQRDCLLTMWCVGGEPHTIQYIYDSVSSARKSATLHILAIGLNDYQDPNLGNLNYAEKDARDVISTIQKKHKHTFANIDAQLLVGRDVTSEMISEKINNLADKATATDMAVIFFAGHGLVDERDRYYLSTYNITNANTPRRGGYSASQFVEDISYINCKLLVFIDACYSGKLLEGYRGSVSSENFFREMNNTPNGTCIYTSSNKDVKSKESAKYKHGVFTQALIESFEFENSDVDGDNRISVIEVRNYLEKRIPQLTQNKQKPIYRNVEEIDFPLFIK